MKKRYFIPLFAAVSFLLIFFHVLLVSFSASLSCALLKQEYGIYNLVIIRTLAVFASILAGLLVAFPMAYFTRMGNLFAGLALPLLGIVLVFSPWQQESVELLRQAYLEWIFLFASCAAFWHIGHKARNRRGSDPTRKCKVFSRSREKL